jgi:hypothetical protein
LAKIGNDANFDKEGALVGVTLIEIEPACILEEIKYPTKDVARIGCIQCAGKQAEINQKSRYSDILRNWEAPYKLIREVAVIRPREKKEAAPAEAAKDQNAGEQKTEKQPARPEVGIENF